MAVVARLLRGEPLEVVDREANVSVAKLIEWRDRALAGAASALKERERELPVLGRLDNGIEAAFARISRPVRHDVLAGVPLHVVTAPFPIDVISKLCEMRRLPSRRFRVNRKSAAQGNRRTIR